VTCGVWIFVGYWTVDTAEGYKNAVDHYNNYPQSMISVSRIVRVVNIVV
jgi:hypothetical protein